MYEVVVRERKEMSGKQECASLGFSILCFSVLVVVSNLSGRLFRVVLVFFFDLVFFFSEQLAGAESSLARLCSSCVRAS